MGRRRSKREHSHHQPPARETKPTDSPAWSLEARAYDSIVRCEYPRKFGTFMPGGQVLPALFRAASDPLLRSIVMYKSELPPTYDIHPYKADPTQYEKELAWGTISVSKHSPSDVIRLLRVEARRPDQWFVGTDYGVEGQYVARDRTTNELRAFVVAHCVEKESINDLHIHSIGDVDGYLSSQLKAAANRYYLGVPDSAHWRNAPLEYPIPGQVYTNNELNLPPSAPLQPKEIIVNLPE